MSADKAVSTRYAKCDNCEKDVIRIPVVEHERENCSHCNVKKGSC